ncbi:hypothetical protein P120_gp35 [Pelagibacter phage HTVC120P]|nr:hypothetical protein P120_gp35 [Pelagibacter phage HTVC120P]
MAYTSKVKGLGYQRTAIRPKRVADNTELSQIANSLKGFEKSFDKFTKNYKNEEQENAQIVFDTLKAQGITDPNEIKKLIDKGDPRVANLKGYYTKAIVDSNFALSHAIEDFNNINLKVADITGGDENGDAMANLDVDSMFVNEEGNDLRNLDVQSKSYKRAYTDSMNKMRLELDSKVSVAKGLQLNRATNAASFQIIAKAWEQGGAWVDDSKVMKTKNNETDSVETVGEPIYHTSTRTKDLEQLRNDKVVGEKFINKDEWNKQVLNYFEQRVDLQSTTLITDPEEFTDIVTYLTMKRGKNGSLPSYLRTPQTQEQATNIIKSIKGKVATSSKLAIAVDLISKGHAYKKDETTYTDSSGNVKIGLSTEDLNNAIVTWEKTLVEPHINKMVANGDVPKDLAEFTKFQITQKMLDANGIQHPTWKNEITMGFDSINVIKSVGNDDTLDPTGIDIFQRGFKRYQQLRTIYGENVPTKYASTDASSFYEIVNNLTRNTNMGEERAIMKAYEAVNNPTLAYADLKVTKSDIYDDVKGTFDKYFDEMGIPWFEGLLFRNKEDMPDWAKAITRDSPEFDWDDVDMSLVQQRATMTAATMMSAGMKKEDAIKFGINEVVSRHTLVDGVLVNNSSFPLANSEILTEKSQLIAKKFENVWMQKYKEDGKLEGWFNEGDIPLVADRKGDLKHYAEDLVVRPFKSGLLVLTDKGSQLPVLTPNGDFVIISTGDFTDGSIDELLKKDKDFKILNSNAANTKKLLMLEQLKINKK